MKLVCHTKGNVPPGNKKYIFVHASGEDHSLAVSLIRRILSLPDGENWCLWTAEDPGTVMDNIPGPDFRSMLVFIPVVTDAYLSMGLAPSFLADILQRGTAVLPVFDKADTVLRFTEQFGNMHGIFLTNPEADRLIGAQLNRFLPGREITEKILENAFSGRIFLSYRKKDVEAALRIMEVIHDTPSGGRASVWFDEYLAAGRNFNEEITEKLEASDAMALVVTPHLLENGNYVQTTEYPEAVQRKKKIIPIQAEETDRNLLLQAYPHLEPPADIADTETIDKLMQDAGFSGRRVGEAYIDYLLGMAFMWHIGVEKSEKRALQFLFSAADEECPEAYEALSFLYTAGIAVKRDLNKALDYKLKAYRRLIREEPSAEQAEHLFRLLFETDGLSLLLKSRGKAVQSREIAHSFLDFLGRIDPEGNRYGLFRAYAWNEIADLHYDEPGTERADEAEKAAFAALKILNNLPGTQDEDKIACQQTAAYGALAAVCWRRIEMDKAISWAEEAKRIISVLAEKTGTTEHLELARNVSMMLGVYCYDRGCAELRLAKNPLMSYPLSLPAVRELTDTVAQARKLMEISPSLSNREGMALSLYNYGRALPLGKDRKKCFAEAYSIIWQLKQATGDGSFDGDITALEKPLGFLKIRHIQKGKPVESISAERIHSLLQEHEEYASFAGKKR